MDGVTLYGPNWSAYVRTARLALIEKQVRYVLEDVDFSRGAMPRAQLQRQPFGKVPALQHDDYVIYETTAINRYIDSAFQGPALQPIEPKTLGRMNQIIAIVDAYLSADIRLGIVNEGLIKPMLGADIDQKKLQQSFESTRIGLQALSECVGSDQFLTGDKVSLADLHVAPLFDYLARTPGGSDLIKGESRLNHWWNHFSDRSSLLETEPDLSVFSDHS